MRPKFEVGEEVILQSVRSPELNGECVVLECVFERYLNVLTDKEESGFTYQLTKPNQEGTNGWMECALRKKHKPSRISFGDLMSSLKSPVNS